MVSIHNASGAGCRCGLVVNLAYCYSYVLLMLTVPSAVLLRVTAVLALMSRVLFSVGLGIRVRD